MCYNLNPAIACCLSFRSGCCLQALQSLKPDLSGSPAAAVVTKAFKTSWEQVELLGQYQLLLDDGREDEAALALLRLQEVVTASQVAETEEEGDEV